MRILRLLMFWVGGALAVAFLVLVALHSNGSIETDVWMTGHLRMSGKF
jgi:hypothetical protein